MVFVNHTNHASAQWDESQRAAAERYGQIVDVPFPDVGAHWREADVARAAQETAAQIAALQPSAVLCQGEFTYSFALVRLLQTMGIPVLAACSERAVKERVDAEGRTHRDSVFSFVRFRRY